jgi:hypothetical protein
MRKFIILLGAAAGLSACGQSADDAANQAAANAVAAKKAKPAYCFFKDPDTKDWAAARDEDGNVVVKGKAYRQDPRYMAVLGLATVTGAHAEIAPSVTTNNSGYAAPENWWDLSATIPNSAGIDSVTVRCGSKTLAELKLPAKP